MAGSDPRGPARSATDEYRSHAEFRARASEAGIGASVISSEIQGGEHVWECLVTDGHERHYIRVVGSGVGPYPDLSAEDVEQGIERFAASLPSEYRIRHLLNANPLHVDRRGQVQD